MVWPETSRLETPPTASGAGSSSQGGGKLGEAAEKVAVEELENTRLAGPEL